MTVTSTTINEKQPSEYRYYAIDFSNLMSSGETISSIDSLTSELRGEGTSDLTLTGDNVNGQTVEFWVNNGTDKRTYRIECKITTNSGAKLEGDALLKVRDG